MNLLIRGMFSNRIAGHAITSSIEHACVHHTLIDLQKRGLDVTFLPPLAHGTISPQAVEEAIRPDTAFVCLFAVNSETGAKNDLEAIAAICQKRKIPLLVDGVASLGKESITLYPGIAGMGFSGHKIHGPQGSGCVIVRSFLKLSASYTGALQEYGLRPGTENLPAIAGFATAISLLNTALPEAEHRMRSLRDHLQQELLKISSDFRVHGGDNRICNLLNLSFGKHRGEDLLIALDLAGIAVSHGSACSAGALEPSRVLTQMGVPFATAKASLRFSLSRYTTKEEIDRTIALLNNLVAYSGY
ncbi:MAG: cysteine desulfurase [Chlamydiota bacterium]